MNVEIQASRSNEFSRYVLQCYKSLRTYVTGRIGESSRIRKEQDVELIEIN